MQGSWPDFRALVFSNIANSESPAHSSSSWKVPKGRVDGSISSNSISCSNTGSSLSENSLFSDLRPLSIVSSFSSNINPIPGKAALGSGIAAALHAAGGFLRLLGHSDGVRGRKRHDRNRELKSSSDLRIMNRVASGLGPETRIISICSSRGVTSLFVCISSFVKGGWGKLKNHGGLPSMLAAILPPVDTPSLLTLIHYEQDGFGVDTCKAEVFGPQGCNAQAVVVEPRTGVQFPTQLSCTSIEDRAGDECSPCQILAGVGARSKEIIKFKSLKIYAFGLYVQPDHLRAQLGDKYKGFTAEELKDRPDFLEDLLRRHEVEMTVRLVVHYKGLKMGMVRNAFQESLTNRLKKIEGGVNDEGLQTFCSYLSDDIRLHQGSTIDIRWQPGGRLHTEIGGRQVGVIHSPSLCQAFFDLYIGDPPVSVIAKQEIGANFARILQEKGR